jgi:predicted RNA-binding protein with PUA-like domain
MISQMGTQKRFWLMKSEPGVYGIEDLERDGRTGWEGVRNFQARNLLRDEVRRGDRVLFYHSNAEPTGVAGLAEVVRDAYPDPLAFDQRSDYFDPKSVREQPTWYAVELAFVERFAAVVPLATLKATAALEKMMVVQRGSRLSVQPVTRDEYETVLRLARAT